jgi:hypothetical protein
LNLNSNLSIELGNGEKKIENKKEKDQNRLGRILLALAHLHFFFLRWPLPRLTLAPPATFLCARL